MLTTILVIVALTIAGIGYFFPRHKASGTQQSVQVPVLTSLQQRIRNVPSDGAPIVNLAELSNSQFSLYLAPISGAVFAVLLYIIFIGGLVSGPCSPRSIPSLVRSRPRVPRTNLKCRLPTWRSTQT